MLMPWNRDVAVVAAIIIFLFVMLPVLVKCLITHRTLTYVGKSHIRRGGGLEFFLSPKNTYQALASHFVHEKKKKKEVSSQQNKKFFIKCHF